MKQHAITINKSRIMIVISALILIFVALQFLDRNSARSYVGKSEYEAIDKAQAENKEYRVFHLDKGERQPNGDYKKNRLNIEVKNDVVVNVTEN